MRRLLYILTFVAVLGTALSEQPPIRLLLKEYRLEEASKICRQYELLSTANMDTLLACAWVYFRTDNLTQGEKILDQTKKASQLPEYQMLNAYSKVRRKQFDLADGLLENLIQQHKGTAVARQCTALRAEIKELRGQLPSAAFLYTDVIKDDPENGYAHWALGRHYKARGDVRLAIQYLEKTAKLWPKHVQSRYQLAMLYLENGGPDSANDAAKWLAEAYKINKNDPLVLEQLGLAFERKNMRVEAIRYWQRAVEIQKDLKIAPVKLEEHLAASVTLLMQTKQWREALNQLDQAGKVFNELPQSILKRGIIFRNLGEFEKAAVELQRYVKLNQNDGIAYQELGIVYLNLRQLDQAYGYFGKSVTLDPENGITHAWFAFLLEAKGELENARTEWRRATELLKDPMELQKANRKLASVEKKIQKKEKELRKENE